MGHIHGIYDTDAHFVVDPVTRTLKPDPNAKVVVVQHDHNSERISFELPRYGFDGHDMSLCNCVEVHYTNTDRATNDKKSGVYQVDDLQLSQTAEDVVVCSWLISRNATQLVGPLSFAIRFACIGEDGEEVYGLSTAAFSNYSVAAGVFNSVGAEEYPDIVKQHSARITEHDGRIKAVEGSAVRFTAQDLTPEQKTQARENIGAASTEATPELYFEINDDGVISLKPEYRGHCSKAEYPYALSDDENHGNGSKNSELPETIVIPEIVNEIAVTALAPAMFAWNDAVKSITIPAFITEIPSAFCRAAMSLKAVNGTDGVKVMGDAAFRQTPIVTVSFPNLERLDGTGHFVNCAVLVVADLGNKITSLPQQIFSSAESLSCLRNAENVTTVGAKAFYFNRRLMPPAFLSKLGSIGNEAFRGSRVNYNWASLAGCTFGENATSLQLNPTDYWSGCTYTPCKTPMRSTFNQKNPAWADVEIGTTGRTYSAGCVMTSAAMIYSTLMGVDLSSPLEYEERVKAANPDLLTVSSANFENQKQYLEAVGLSAEYREGMTAANLQAIYDALAAGALVLAGVDPAHAVVFHGINEKGEILVTDSESYARGFGIYRAMTYPMFVQNMMLANEHFLIVTKN